jgi:F-type H+-transporting ATPase subunit gamma
LQGDINLSLAEEREIKKVLVVVIAGDKGLCGAFNSNVIKAAKTLVNEQYADLAAQGKVELLFVGKKGADSFRTFKGYQNKDYMDLFTHLSFENAAKTTQFIMDLFEKKEYDRVDVVYNMFKNAASQFATVEQFLPIKAVASSNSKKSADYIFEPEKETILQELVPKILKTQFYRFLLDSNASEHGARMTAMDKATENANELMKGLTLMYNRARQAAITTELTEIVSGAAALSQG